MRLFYVVSEVVHRSFKVVVVVLRKKSRLGILRLSCFASFKGWFFFVLGRVNLFNCLLLSSSRLFEIVLVTVLG